MREVATRLPGAAGLVGLAALIGAVTAVFVAITLVQFFLALAWLAVLLGVLTRTRRDAGTGRSVPVIALAVFAAVSIVSALVGEAPAAGVRVLRAEWLAGGAALAASRLIDPARGALVMKAFLLAAAVAGAWSFYQFAFEFDWTVSFSHRAHGFWHRAAFVSYANALAIAFAAALGLLAWPSLRGRLVPGLTTAASAIGMALSYTRSAWLVSALVLLLVSLWRRAIVPLVLVAALALAVAVAPGRDDSVNIVARARSSFDPSAPANVDRLARYRVGAAVVRDHPLLGVGPGALRVVYDRYAIEGARENWHLHNAYLQLLAERGPFGLLAWVLAFGGAALYALRASRRVGPDRRGLAAGVALALVAFLLLGAFNYHWGDWRIRALALVLLGLACSPAVSGDRDLSAWNGRP